jgi:uncharacterized membrane protein required for colicin V production
MADVLFLGLFGGFIAGGFRTGFVRRLFGLLFMAVSFVLGAYLRGPLGAIVIGFFPDIPAQYADAMGYSVAFTVLVAGFNFFSRTILSKLAVQGVSEAMDKVLGAAFGFLEAALIASAAIVILHTYSAEVATLEKLGGLSFLKDLADGVDKSVIGKLLEQTTVPLVVTILGPLLPTDISKLLPTTIPGLPGGSVPLGGIPGIPVTP